MAAGMINISVGGNGSTAQYILRSGETVESWSNIATEKKEIILRINDFYNLEITGSKELGINANSRARGMTKLIVSLPNKNTNLENKDFLKEVLKKSGIADFPHVVSIHKGEKEGVKNRHAHVMYFERNFIAGNSKKNRVFNGKHFFENLKKDYQETFGFSKNEKERERIPTKNFELGRQLESEQDNLREEIKTIEKQIKNERFRERLELGRSNSGRLERPEDGHGGYFKAIADSIGDQGDQSANRGGESPRIDHKDLIQQLADNIREDERIAEEQRAAAAAKQAAERERHLAERNAPAPKIGRGKNGPSL